MRKTAFIMLAACLAALPIAAQDQGAGQYPNPTFDGDAEQWRPPQPATASSGDLLMSFQFGGWYDDRPLPEGFGNYATAFNMRWGYSCGAKYMATDWLYAGSEVGLHFAFFSERVNGYEFIDWRGDFPLEYKIGIRLPYARIEGKGGIVWNVISNREFVSEFAWTAGARLSVGPLFADWSLVFPFDTMVPRNRWGGGILFDLAEGGNAIGYR